MGKRKKQTKRGKGKGKASPRSAIGQAWLQEAVAHHRAGRLQLAAALYNAVLERDPQCADALHLAGLVAHQRGRHLEALGLIERAIGQVDDRPAYYASYGAVLMALQRPAAAAAALDRALVLDGHHPEALYNRGLLHRSLGQLDAARAVWSRLAEIRPDDPEVLRLLASVSRPAPGDELMRRLQHLAERPDLPVQGRVDCWFALGKAWEDIGDYDRAFACFAAGNREKRATFHYAIEEDRRFFAAIERHCVSLPSPVAGDPEPVPIFIVGMPRSGTSLVEQILACHPQVTALGEQEVVRQVIDGPYADKTGRRYPNGIGTADGDLFAELGRQCCRRYRELAPDASYITDKLPHNFLYIGVITRMLPNARIIHCRRQPLDTCLSCYKNDFAMLHRWAYDLSEIGEYWLLYDRLMAHWRRILGESLFEIDYEELVSDLEGAGRRLLAHCGLDWDARCLDFHRCPRPVSTASAVQVRRPLYTSSIGLWRRYAAHLAPLQEVLARRVGGDREGSVGK